MTSDRPGAGAVRLAPCVLYLVVEFVRPMDWYPFMAALRPGLVAAVCGVGGLLWFKDRPVPRSMWWLLGLVALMAWHVPWATNNRWALWGLQDFALLVVGGVLPLALLPRSVGDVKLLTWTYFLAHVPAAYHAIRYAGRGVGGWMGDENDLALALIVSIGLGVFLAIESRTLRWRAVALASIGAMLAAVVFSVSRGGMVGLGAVVIFLIVVGPYRRVVIALCVVGAIGVVLLAPPVFWAEFESIGDSAQAGDTGETRLYYWGLATDMFLDHPITGVGTNNFGIRAPDYQDPYRQGWGTHTWGRVAHSLYFTLIAEQGLVGIIIFAALLRWIASTFRRLRRENAVEGGTGLERTVFLVATALAAGLFAHLTCGAFLSVLYYPPFWALLGLLAALESAVEGDAVPDPRAASGGRRAR